MNSPSVHDPLTKLQCCPTSDGSAAAILASEDFVKARGLQGQAVEILGIGNFNLANERNSLMIFTELTHDIGFKFGRKENALNVGPGISLQSTKMDMEYFNGHFLLLDSYENRGGKVLFT